jgi:hypothetical protein
MEKMRRLHSLKNDPLIRRMSSEVDTLIDTITKKGVEIKTLKAGKASKEIVGPAVEELLKLKSKYEELTGNPYDKPKPDSTSKPLKDNKTSKASAPATKEVESLVITSRQEDYSAWSVCNKYFNSFHCYRLLKLSIHTKLSTGITMSYQHQTWLIKVP